MNTRKMILAASLLAGSFAAAQTAQKINQPISLDVVVRDFEPSHSDFENFSEEFISTENSDHPWGFNIYNCSVNGCDFSIDARDFKGDYRIQPKGYDFNWYSDKASYHTSCGNKASLQGVALGKDGLPFVANQFLPDYVQQVSASTDTLKYGECSKSDGMVSVGGTVLNIASARGFKDNVAAFEGIRKNSCTNTSDAPWANPVFYTPGMVEPRLKFDSILVYPVQGTKPDMGVKEFFLNHTVISKASEKCDNENFDQWFKDFKNINKRSNMTLDLPPMDGNPDFKEINYNYNNGGYFPLDNLDSNGLYDGPRAGTDQFGAQSFSIFCPPYDYQYAGTQEDYLGNKTFPLCYQWNTYGGAKGLSAENAKNLAANDLVAKRHLRNYNFTMMGYSTFQYFETNNQSDAIKEIFEFAGDDDMWIFIDGVLVVDLGGTHLATPGIVDIRNLAMHNHGCTAGEPLADYQQKQGACGGGVLNAGGWTDGSWHHLHFFYADRQTDGSNLYIRANLSAIGSSRYAGPEIAEAEATLNESGQVQTIIYVNNRLSEESVSAIATSNGSVFPILAKRRNAAGGLDTLAYNVTNFEYLQFSGKGFSYRITGKLCEDALCTVQKNPGRGDSLTFNYIPTDPENLELVNNRFFKENLFSISATNGATVDHYSWGPITSMSTASSTTVIPADTTIDRPPFDDSKLDKGELSDSQTGEIIVTPLPADIATAENRSQWIAENLKKYSQAPGDGSAPEGQVVINSKTNKTASTVDNARCATSNGTENCVSFSFVTDQAFRVTVRVFDHLGHFVSQYSQEMTPEQFNKVSGSYATNNSCNGISLNGSGFIAASVKTYPVSQNGRKLGTGAYIYQISLIEYPQPHCFMAGDDVQLSEGEYRRTEYKQTRGFRRIVEK